MRTAIALIVKFIATFAAAYIAFNVFGEESLTWTTYVAILGTALNYVLGDLVVLRNFGNVIASIGDGLMAALTAWVIALMTTFNTTFTELLVFGLIVAGAEFIFHNYLKEDKKVAPFEK